MLRYSNFHVLSILILKIKNHYQLSLSMHNIKTRYQKGPSSYDFTAELNVLVLLITPLLFMKYKYKRPGKFCIKS